MTLEKTSPNLSPTMEAVFALWYSQKYFHIRKPEKQAAIQFLKQQPFYNMPFDFQQGVYLSFLREKGVDIWAGTALGELGGYLAVLYGPDELSRFVATDYNTALIAAIEAGFARLETPSE